MNNTNSTEISRYCPLIISAGYILKSEQQQPLQYQLQQLQQQYQQQEQQQQLQLQQ